MRGYVEQLQHYFDRPHVGVPTAAVGGTSAWVGSDFSDETWIEVLSDDVIAELDRIASGEAGGHPQLDSLVDGWRSTLSTGVGFVLAKGLPVDRWTRAQTEHVCWELGRLLGEPGAQNLDGDLLGHVIDLDAENDANERLYRTNKNIGFHCDAADVVGLLCLDTAVEGGASRIVSSTTVHDLLRSEAPELADRLFEPVKLDSRRPEGSRTRYTEVVPCAYDGSRLRTFMHLEYMRSVERFDDAQLDPVLRSAFEAWERIAERPDVHLSMDLEPGDLQLVSNHSIVHARTGYVDDPERPRHLLRLWLSL